MPELIIARPSLSQYLLVSLLLICNYARLVVVDAAGIYTRSDFPADFVFGSGTSAYQVEGAANEDGRTPSIWDTFDHAGNSGGANGDIACDMYHKYKEDVKLMVDTGLEAYRFSISWSRLIPNGRGPVNPKGLKFYNNFIDELIKQGIQPHVTMYHGDLPQILEDEYGGWIDRRSVKDFVAYADVCFREFGDRVLQWTTINEANIYAFGGYDQGITPPGRCSSPFGLVNCSRGDSTTEPYLVTHNLLLAHASAARLYQKKYKALQPGFIGINLYTPWYTTRTNSLKDAVAAQRVKEFSFGWFMNPLVFGDYPETMKKTVGMRLPAFTEFESKLVKGSFDFLGINHYTPVDVKDNSQMLKKDVRDYYEDMAAEQSFPTDTPDQYPIVPKGMQQVLEYFKIVYGNPPIYVQENGQRTVRNGTLIDTPRVEYLQALIGGVLDAVRNGSNTKGYFMWSFLDGLELLYGYDSGFGLYYVDLDDKELRRYPKLSQRWYSNLLKGRSIVLDEVIRELEENEYVSSQSHMSE